MLSSSFEPSTVAQLETIRVCSSLAFMKNMRIHGIQNLCTIALYESDLGNSFESHCGTCPLEREVAVGRGDGMALRDWWK